MNHSEKHIIDLAIDKVQNGTATEEQKILVELYNANTLRKSMNSFYNHITPLNTKSKTIKDAFESFENSILCMYNTLYEHCGCSYMYTIANISEYVEDFLREKIDNTHNPKPSKKFILLEAREYMEDDRWYSLSEIKTIIDDINTDYDVIFKRFQMLLLITDCVQEGYFTEKTRTKNTGPRYFKKTNKEYLDFT